MSCDFFLGLFCRLLWGVELRWVWLSIHFFWIGADVLLVFPLFWSNICRHYQWRGDPADIMTCAYFLEPGLFHWLFADYVRPLDASGYGGWFIYIVRMPCGGVMR